jgi:methionyl-tRNA synthetase
MSRITIDQFAEVEMKVGTILEAEDVPGSDKLVKLKVDIGEERQVVAGIKKMYKPEELVDKQVIIVANLKAAKLMGIESQGMVLCADTHKGPILLAPSKEVPNGSKIK